MGLNERVFGCQYQRVEQNIKTDFYLGNGHGHPCNTVVDIVVHISHDAVHVQGDSSCSWGCQVDRLHRKGHKLQQNKNIYKISDM